MIEKYETISQYSIAEEFLIKGNIQSTVISEERIAFEIKNVKYQMEVSFGGNHFYLYRTNGQLGKTIKYYKVKPKNVKCDPLDIPFPSIDSLIEYLKTL